MSLLWAFQKTAMTPHNVVCLRLVAGISHLMGFFLHELKQYGYSNIVAANTFCHKFYIETVSFPHGLEQHAF